jgi:cytidylate kinase
MTGSEGLDLTGVVIAVDGPSGAGKSSVSRGVAKRLGLRYLDTGAMYRAVTWWLLEHGIDVQDPAAVAAATGKPHLEIGTDPAAPTITVDGVDVRRAIRTDRVTAAVSAVSAVPDVRARMVQMQRDAIGAGGIVVEGRDIGTAVAPNAAVKVFLTASEEVRAARRAAEHSAADAEATRVAQRRRDQLDSSRPASPLRKAADAEMVDATDLSLQAVVGRVVQLVRDRVAGPSVQRSRR